MGKQNNWISHYGMITRQIDYIAINHKFRDAVTQTHAIQGWGEHETETTTLGYQKDANAKSNEEIS